MYRHPLIQLGGAMLLGAMWWGCGDSAESCPPDEICSSGGSGNGGPGVGPGAGPGGPGAGGSGASGVGGAGTGGGSLCQVSCTPWETDGVSDQATRTCTQCEGQPVAVETTTLPALDLGYFKCNVQPVMNRACSQMGCHGNDDRALRIYSRGRYRRAGETLMKTCSGSGTVDASKCTGSIECECFNVPKAPGEWQHNFDSARGFLLDFVTGMPLADSADSELLTQPTDGSPRAHANMKIFNQNDAEYTALKAWLDGATANCQTND